MMVIKPIKLILKDQLYATLNIYRIKEKNRQM